MMDASNIKINLPFDEPNGSLVAYDYSNNRTDATVIGAIFVPGRNGNAISFNGNATCEVSANVIDLTGNFTIVLRAKNTAITCGSPTKLIWMLNFTGDVNYNEVAINALPDDWIDLALVKRGTFYSFYANGSLVSSFAKTSALLGISLNQDYYGSTTGLGCLDDVKCYNIALTQDEVIAALAPVNKNTYLLDGVDFKEYGVYVSEAEGLFKRPKLKEFASVSWDNYHGNAVDLTNKYCDSREITLSCFIKANGKVDFANKVFRFAQLFDKAGSQRLTVEMHPTKPLVFEVYCKDEIDVSKRWNDELMVGTFSLKLIEAEPVKRVLRHIRTGEANKTCSITLTSNKLVNIYWGDGTHDYDVSGTSITKTHNYTVDGQYNVIITGCIDEISAFTTNAIIVWNKL